MRKIITTAIAALAYGTLAHAGSMGPVATAERHAVPYLSGEGSYTWNDINNVTINGYSGTQSTNGWGGRLAAGIVRPYTDKLSLTAEVGGGYYGSTSTNIYAAGVTGRSSIDGYDVLVGALYDVSYEGVNRLGLFGDVGFMVQNMRTKLTQNYALSTPGGLFSGTTTAYGSQTQVLPELKVGGLYNVCENLDLSLAYMYVFGSNTHGSRTMTASASSFALNGTVNRENPALSTLLFGLRYNFA